MYIDGIEGVLPPQPEKAKELDRIYAAKGYPNYQYFYACDLFDEDKHEEAYPLFCKAAKAGEPRAYFFVGNYYENGVAAPHDDAKAAEYYQKAIDSNIPVKAGCYNRLGAMYFDGRGVEQDYDKAFRLLKWADDSGKTGNWGAYYLGYCYTYGEGTERDYVLARKYLEAVDWECQDAFFLLGWLYCNGEGGPEDIAKGVSYLQKAKDLPEAQEELSHYKKNFFGKWVRRDKTETVLRGLLRLQSMFGSDKKEAPQGDGGESGQDAQQVVGEEGEKEGQHQKDIGLGVDHIQIFFRDLSAHQAGDCVSAQAAGQREHQQRAGGDCGKGEQEGDPGAEEHPSGQGGDVAGDGGQDDGQELDQEEAEVGVGRKILDIRPQGLLRTGGGKKSALPQKQPPANAQQDGEEQKQPFEPSLHP
mgnify:CR=1 FL=1